MTDPENDPAPGVGAALARFANWINEHIVGSPWTFLACIILVLGVDALIPIQGYSHWNVSTGLFSNTQESSFELITGVGAVCGVYAVRRSQKQHREEVRALHAAHKSLHDKLAGLLQSHHGARDDIAGLAEAVRAMAQPAGTDAVPPAVKQPPPASRKLRDPNAPRGM